MSKEEIPPWLREQLTRFEQLQQTLQSILVQKQQVELELAEIEKATSELDKTPDTNTVYKSTGSILVKVAKKDLVKELIEKKEIATTRSMVLAKQEVRVRDNVKELQEKLDKALRTRTQTQPSES